MCGAPDGAVEGAEFTTAMTSAVVELAGELESNALMERVNDPAVVGVPLRVQPFSVNPAGAEPLASAQVYGAVPPLTPIVPV